MQHINKKNIPLLVIWSYIAVEVWHFALQMQKFYTQNLKENQWQILIVSKLKNSSHLLFNYEGKKKNPHLCQRCKYEEKPILLLLYNKPSQDYKYPFHFRQHRQLSEK